MKKILSIALALMMVVGSAAYAATGGFDFSFAPGNWLGIGKKLTATSTEVSKADSEAKAYVTITNNALASGDEVKVFVRNASGTQVTNSVMVNSGTSTANQNYKSSSPAYGANVKYTLRGEAELLSGNANFSGRWTP